MENKGLTLIGSTTSPYVRKLRLFMEAKIPYEFMQIDFNTAEAQAFVRAKNPLNKIPVLLHGEQIIFESRIIYRYLNAIYKLEKELSIDEENILSATDGVMDATITLFLMNRMGIPTNQDLPFINRQRERIHHGLTELGQFQFPEWNFLSMSLYAYLDWANFREMIKLENYSILKNFHQKYSTAQGVLETKIKI